MILTMEQMKYLKPDGNEKYKFVGQKTATKNEKKELLEIDKWCFFMDGEHFITNFKDLE